MDTSSLLSEAQQAQSSGDIFGMSMGALAAGFIFSGLGLVYVKYGKTTGNHPMLACGILLMVYPYFISNTTYLILTGLLLAAAPKLYERFLAS